MLTAQNYSKGLLIDDECLGGVSEHPENTDFYIAYVMNHLTAEYLNYGEFKSLEKALEAINSIPRSWTFEKAGGCNGCSAAGKCDGGGCKKKESTTENPCHHGKC